MTPLVLLADDAEDVLEAHGEILADAGYRIAYARDGREAVQKAIDLRPDVILMDLQMPGLDGWEATRRIRADLRTHRTPIIAFTGHGLRRYADRSFDAGCTSFLEKPCPSPRALVDEVRRALARAAPFGTVVSELPDAGSGASGSGASGSRR
jgi:two-component system cell cycle response regulator DivK